MIEKIVSTMSGASPIDGSSSRRSRGSPMSARPIASICCSPPERSPPSWLRRSARTGNSSKISSSIALCVPPAVAERAHLEVLRDRHRGEDAAALGDVADAELDDAVRDERRTVDPVERDGAARGVVKPREHPQRRGLARAVRAEERDDLALVDGQR